LWAVQEDAEEIHVYADQRAEEEVVKVLSGCHVHREVEFNHLFLHAREESNNFMQAHQLWARDRYVDPE
jgi:hypothetical protein